MENFPFACSMIIVAVGFGPNNIIVKTTENLKINDKGLVITDENFETSVPGVFCAGDVQTGAATVIKALGNGKVAGQSMNFWIAQNHATLPRDNDLFGKVISPGICPPAEKLTGLHRMLFLCLPLRPHFSSTAI